MQKRQTQKPPISTKCTDGISQLVKANKPSVWLVCAGTVAKAALNVLSGTLTYRVDPVEDSFNITKEDVVKPPGWISEPVFWFEWIHCGDLDAKVAARCIQVDASAFSNEIRKHSDAYQVAQVYAQARLQEIREMSTSMISDLYAIDKNLGFMRLESSELVIPELARRMKDNQRGTVRERLMRWFRMTML
eukprot:4565325-Amphidinium_carterae.1